MGRQGTVDDWRKDLLEIIESYVEEGVGKFEWITANDENVCPKCYAREGKVFTLKELKKELSGKFCEPPDPDDRCRCTLLPNG